MDIDVSLPIFLIGLFSFISWCLFALFGGVGLASVPLDLIFEYFNRPKKITHQELEQLKNKISYDSMQLIELGQEVKHLEEIGAPSKNFWNKDKRAYVDKFKNLKRGVLILDTRFEMLKIQSDINGTGAAYYFLTLIVGLFTLIISLIWIIHM